MLAAPVGRTVAARPFEFMEQVSYYASIAGFVLVMALWFLFGGVFLLRKKPEATTDGEKMPVSWVGLALQGLGFIPVWVITRTPRFGPFIDGQNELNIALQIAAVAVAAFSVWFAMSAVHELGCLRVAGSVARGAAQGLATAARFVLRPGGAGSRRHDARNVRRAQGRDRHELPETMGLFRWW